MEKLSQDFVVRIKYAHEKLGMFEFVIPNNTPTVEALEVLAIWQKVLVDSLKKQEEQKEEPTFDSNNKEAQEEVCHTTIDPSDKSIEISE